MTPKHFASTLGFATVAAWIAFGFGNALLCLLGAAAGYGLALVAEGQIDLGKLQDRLRPSEPPPVGAPPATWSSPRPRRVR